MTPQTRRLILAILAWPAGIVAALLVVVVMSFFSSPTCTTQEVAIPGSAVRESSMCEVELKPASPTVTILWLALAFGPGIVATRAWWKGRDRDTL